MATKSKTKLRIIKVTYGTKPIEQAFREALAPYFAEPKEETKRD
jgi:hypothetical protein